MHPAFNKVKTNLLSGRVVNIESLHITETYGGLLEGYPTSEMNEEIIEESQTMMADCWGSRRTHVISPTLFRHESGRLFLPPWLCLVWLSCGEPIKSAFTGSELVVIWFAHDVHSIPIEPMVNAAVQRLDWESLAADFDF